MRGTSRQAGWEEAAVSQWRYMCDLTDQYNAGPETGVSWNLVRSAALRLIEILAYAGSSSNEGMYLDAVYVLQHRRNRPLVASCDPTDRKQYPDGREGRE
jgi:hypothetical protein